MNLINFHFYHSQIASHSKSSTRSRFWNRSFHILSCDRSMEARVSGKPSNALNNANNSENRRCRLDRKLNGRFRWSRCNWQRSLAVAVIIVLLNLTSIECLQARQEGMYRHVQTFNHRPPPGESISLNYPICILLILYLIMMRLSYLPPILDCIANIFRAEITS